MCYAKLTLFVLDRINKYGLFVLVYVIILHVNRAVKEKVPLRAMSSIDTLMYIIYIFMFIYALLFYLNHL